MGPVNVTIGQYFPGDSLIHRMDPRTKLLFTILYIVLVFLVRDVLGYAAVIALLAVSAAVARLPVKYLLRSLKPMIFIVVLTFLLNLITFGDGGVRITWTGLLNAVTMSLRLILLVLGSQLLTLTTSPLALTDGIEQLMRPLKAIKFPAHEMAMMMTIALRFIPTLVDETDRIMKAQKSRGADFESGNLLARARALIPLLVPLFVSAFRRADELAMAMEARCYRGDAGRTQLKQLAFSRVDLYGLGAAVLLTALVAVDRWVL